MALLGKLQEPLSKEVQLIRGETEHFNMKAETMTIEEVKRQRSKATTNENIAVPIELCEIVGKIPTDPHHPIHLQFFSDGLPLDYDRKANLDHYKDTSARPAPKTSPPHRHLPHNFSCIVMNPFVPWVSDVAAQHRIPAPCTFGSNPALSTPSPAPEASLLFFTADSSSGEEMRNV
ncbi:hypothetical protein Syun_023900 [Stephania yunnanensis]|uniref:Uncharacterized protein n=1 Tax=Stephania yunnanensis TaxID=152371 RepID=A0AAP0FQL3_9MAGN